MHSITIYVSIILKIKSKFFCTFLCFPTIKKIIQSFNQKLETSILSKDDVESINQVYFQDKINKVISGIDEEDVSNLHKKSIQQNAT